MLGPERSLGCYRCRSMKLKCDQEHPDCRRCQRVNVKCPGYRHENDLIFIDVSNKVREREATAQSEHARKNTGRPVRLIEISNKPKARTEMSHFGSLPPPATWTVGFLPL
ncbi:hypothetical protein DL95DRAFT_418089 [Leptodontidium sp. 2 PMI_412]|nr:hypothetical protein DL95DRAFT_418089 [Leptodontidium sp. 2 PMI_412]